MIRTTAGIAIALLVVGCGSSLGKPEDLAKTVGVAYVHEEDEIMNKKPILTAWDAKKSEYGTDPLAGVVTASPTDDELQRILSMLRVFSVTEEIDPTKKVAFQRDAAGKAGQARRVQVRFADPTLTLDLSGNCGG